MTVRHETSSTTAGRAVAPDVARGLMLLLIALANVSWFLYGHTTSSVNAHRVGTTGLDAVWQSVAIIAIDGRSYPLFAFLFGYGIWQLYTRQQALGRDERAARRLLQVRNLLLIVFGAVHAALLWYGDVLGAYGLIGLIVVWLFLRRADRTLWTWAIVLVSLLAAGAALGIVGGLTIPPEYVAMTEASLPQLAGISPYTASILPRLAFWAPLVVGQGVIGLVVPAAVLLAIVFARRRVLEAPWEHRTLLRRTAIVGVAVGWAGAVPELLVHHGAWDVPDWTAVMLQSVTGLFAALGYVALFALATAGAGRAPGAIGRALAAVGKRSLSSYLLQSVIFAPVLCAWGLGLGGVLSPWQAALFAVAVWLVSVGVAMALERAGRRGPAEWLLRALAYGAGRSSATPVSS
ncbi:DUF418 domain-containing protein [Microbacterium marinilacus]|uniref:DUF418 domain-containing protein n=1 Tax=Microbacterium marinilacus TaxID=415209 RepID=A0ABP7BAZ9_9MICO|nr:DUF418 domain-containing protein [Microbacterium marinilacus]MBY0686916.1 DUF418 domain-containing protein [Microbacterium marinilacus]